MVFICGGLAFLDSVAQYTPAIHLQGQTVSPRWKEEGKEERVQRVWQLGFI